jgi:hypothetical protein
MHWKYAVTFLILIGLAFQIQTIVYRSDALLQVAGPIIIKIKPGETQTFQWGILPDNGKSANVTISTYGNGSQFLSFPKTVQLPVGKSIFVPIKVSIPTNYSGNDVLAPKLRATQAGVQSNGGSIVNLEVAKNVTIRVLNVSDIVLPK